MTITVYCAYCLRPLTSQFRRTNQLQHRRVKVRTETCERVPIWKRGEFSDGTGYWQFDGLMTCAVEVFFP